LHEWVHEAVARLAEGPQPDVRLGLPRWQHDPDGIFRKLERPIRVWPHAEAQATWRQLPTWSAVEQALEEDDRLRGQPDQWIGTTEGGGHFDADAAALAVLPLPDEVGELEATFARRYGELDRFLATEEIEYLVIWPLPGLRSSEFPITLEQDIQLDIMSDRELAAVLNTGALSLMFPGWTTLPAEYDHQACLRYRYSLPKVIGDLDPQTAKQDVASEAQLNDIRDILEQVLALLFPDPVAVSGRASFPAEWTPQFGGVVYYTTPLTPTQRFRQLHLNQKASAAIVSTWKQLRQPGLLQNQKALALALRRLSYQAQRQRVEDEMVDVMVAAEALYLAGLGPGELGFRLALRASALSDPPKLGMTRRAVFDLMKSAYDVRSKIVHGDEPKPKDLKVKGAQVSLPDFIQATEEVVRQGLTEALHRATSPKDKWPPDWDAMTLPK
jgi:Apea-like HEPN